MHTYQRILIGGTACRLSRRGRKFCVQRRAPDERSVPDIQNYLYHELSRFPQRNIEINRTDMSLAAYARYGLDRFSKRARPYVVSSITLYGNPGLADVKKEMRQCGTSANPQMGECL